MPRGIASGFDPRSIAGLEFWLDAEDISTLTLNDTTVSQWRDKSGNNRHVSQATASRQPTYSQSGNNGRASVEFRSADTTWLDGSSWRLVEQTAFMVWQNLGGGNSLMALSTGPFAANVQNQVILNIGGAYRTFTLALGAAGNANINPAVGSNRVLTNGTPVLVSWTYNGGGFTSTASYGIRRNQNVIASEASSFIGSAGNAIFRLGSDKNGTTATSCSGRLSAMLIYSRVLSPYEILTIEQVLAATYNV